MDRLNSVATGTASAVLRAIPEGQRFCALILVLILATMVAGCAVDREKVDRTQEDLRALCEDPVTRTGRALCDRYLPEAPAPAPQAAP